jgi:hypothetical protein
VIIHCDAKHNLDTTLNMNQHNIMYRSLTYIPELSERVSSILKKQILHLTIGYKTQKSLSDIYSRVKDKDDRWLQSNLVYSIACINCKDCSYIGVTTQYLKSRIYQHKKNVSSFLLYSFGGNESDMELLKSIFHRF